MNKDWKQRPDKFLWEVDVWGNDTIRAVDTSWCVEMVDVYTAEPKQIVAVWQHEPTGKRIGYVGPLFGNVTEYSTPMTPEFLTFMEERTPRNRKCICGARSIGWEDFTVGHASWCDVAPH